MPSFARSVHRARRQRSGALSGYIVTWDVNSRDSKLCGRVRRFVFGNESQYNGRVYRYPGFVERHGVRYLGQSVLFVTEVNLASLRQFLDEHGVAHHVTAASLGRF